MAHQHFAQSSNPKAGKQAFINDLPARRVADGVLVLCGETNIASMIRHSDFNDSFRFTDRLREMSIGPILNPIHDYFTVAVRNYHDAGNAGNSRPILSFLAAVLDRLGRYESAATIAGFAVVSPFVEAWTLEISAAIAHLRDVLGDQTYESLAWKGETMTTAAMATYAYDQIDQARAALEHPS